MTTGFLGPLDFTGLPIGEGFTPLLSPASSGFYDFFSLGGLFAGQGTAVAPPVSKRGHAPKVAGQLYIQAYLKWLQERRELNTSRPGRARVRVLSRSVIQAEQERIEDQKKGVELQLYSVLLAEI